jgi:hypothetical protein
VWSYISTPHRFHGAMFNNKEQGQIYFHVIVVICCAAQSNMQSHLGKDGVVDSWHTKHTSRETVARKSVMLSFLK